ncbi:DEAD/DEAH box helicase [Legionella sainthelensi]|uniref:DEAD/DEAH box helicase n=1 Tax=Legionella sainthelensi TaxID=28087 RepID=UPI000E1FC2FE|nr:DEAD/DEAH box helicase family protein [Legionella sainthelensi]
MAIHPDFPNNPYSILDPNIRWFPGDQDINNVGHDKLIPPLVHKIRTSVNQWRNNNYEGASWVTRALLTYWFELNHYTENSNNQVSFKWYFAQREAVESAIWLYEITKARNPSQLLSFDSSGLLQKEHFKEDWPRYVMKLATGSGKTKVLSLLITWCYFHKKYEALSDLSLNFLVVAPNIIVLDRLKVDFDGLQIFHQDPLLPYNGYLGKNWQDDFNPAVHIQDEVGNISDNGNIYLTNVHRLFLPKQTNPSIEDIDATDYFLGAKPPTKTTSVIDLGELIRKVPDLVILNDEAHHIHDESLTWFTTIKDIHTGLVERGHKLSVQFDVTATPRHANGAIFANTISDYPLCEAIYQGVVKHPVIPDDASMAKLQEKTSDEFVERYEDHINLGYVEWKKVYDQQLIMGKKAVLFIMTDETKSCDQIKEYLESTYPEFKGAVLVIHTKRNGDINEGLKSDLDELRKASREIDRPDNPYKVIVSVLMLREGWDVKNVTTIVGLRSYSASSKILPEQTLGRGRRRMYREKSIGEEPKLSVIGTEKFIDFVKKIKSEGVELDYKPMGVNTPPKAPIVITVDDNKKMNKDLEIVLPKLTRRMQRNLKNLNELNPTNIISNKIKLKKFSENEQRQIIFRDINTEEISHTTDMPTLIIPDYHRALHFFTHTIMSDLRMVGGSDILFEKLKIFIECNLFETRVDLDDLNVITNLSENSVRKLIIEGFKKAINMLTVSDSGTSEIRDTICVSKTRPFQVSSSDFVIISKKSAFTKMACDNHFELNFAKFLDSCEDIMAFEKINDAMGFFLDYRNQEGGIANYYPDFIVKRNPKEYWIVELKGREGIDDIIKMERLEQWCRDATNQDKNEIIYNAMYIREDEWGRYRPRNFKALIDMYFNQN